MTTNQTIDGVLVPRELLSYWAECLESAGFKDRPAEMRALLDAPAPPSVAVGHIEQRRSMGLAIGAPITNVIWDLPHPELQHLPNGAKVYLHPAAQPQGEPVAWANWKVGSKSYIPYRTVDEARRCVNASEISATQNGPYQVVPLYAEQPAPVAVVMPERSNAVVSANVSAKQAYALGWNACIDEVNRLNTKE
jgi:hypothetical protein